MSSPTIESNAHIPGKTDLKGIADRIKESRDRMNEDMIAFSVLLYYHESIDVEEALRRVIEGADR